MPENITIIVPGQTQVITAAVPGIQGPPAKITVNNVITGAPGTSAAASSTQNAAGENIVSFTIPRGDVGPANSLIIGTVTTGAVGANATASITGTYPNQALNLTLPRGAQGTQGVQGVAGPTGPANTLTIGTVTSGNAAASITGTAPNQVLNLTLPQGPQGLQGIQGLKGDKGDQGIQGPAGPAGQGIAIAGSAATYSVLPTNLTAADAGKGYLVNADGKLYIWDGTKFPANGSGAAFQGPAGPANTLSIASTTTGAAGSNAAVTVGGTAPSQTLAFTIPRGATGATGPANSLTIGTVSTGAAGSSASATITGTASSQTLNLTLPAGPAGTNGATGATGAKGDKGDTGTTGPAGPVNVLTIGTVTTGAPGTPAGASITGTAPNQTLNLTIPQGQQGPTGASGTGTGSGTVTAANITDASTIGRTIITAADAAAVRAAIGAGTSSLVIGTTATTAMAGNRTFSKADVGLGNVDNTADTAKPVSAATQTALNLKATASESEVVKNHDGSATGGTRPGGYMRVRWVGGTTRPTNMIAGDVWERAGTDGGGGTSGSVTSANITDASTIGRTVLTAVDAAAIRTAIAAAAATHTHGISGISATGTPSSSTYLRGDGTWATVPTGTGGTGTASYTTMVYPETYNASAGTGSDDTTALRAAMAAMTAGSILWLSPGKTYRHNAVLNFTTSNITIAGGGRLLATTAATSSVQIRGTGVTVLDITLETINRTQRLDPYEAQKFVVFGDNFTAINVTSKGSAATGFFLTGVDGFLLQDCKVFDTYADGIHMTGGSSNGQVIRPVVTDAGDDGVAVVSYVGGADPGLCQNITVTRPTVYGSKAGRGVTCVGGVNVLFTDIYTDDTFAAGVYIANETYGSNPIHPVTNVRVSSGTVKRANRNTDPIGGGAPVDHGAILISSQRTGQTNSNVVVENITCIDTRKTAPWEVGILSSGGTNDGITIRGMRFINPANGSSGTNPVNYFSGWNGGTNTNIKFYGWFYITEAMGRLNA